MNQNEALDAIEKFLQQHKDGLGGSIHQEPYKGDFFNIFAAAFKSGLLDQSLQSGYLSAEALTDSLASRSPQLLEQQTWNELRTFWEEWTYAWRRCELLKR